VEGVDAGDEIEEVAALAGLEEDALEGKLLPCGPLASQEEQAVPLTPTPSGQIAKETAS